jgi:hypothetical protein
MLRSKSNNLLEYEQKVIILANELDRVNQALMLKTNETLQLHKRIDGLE